MMYKKRFWSTLLLCATFAIYQIDAKCKTSCKTDNACKTNSSCKTACKTKSSCKTKCTKKKACCAPQSSASLDCIPAFTDYIIVGFGTAGATLARFLSNPVDGEYVNQVTVLEAGIYRSDDPIVRSEGADLFQSQETLAVDPKYSEVYGLTGGTGGTLGTSGVYEPTINPILTFGAAQQLPPLSGGRMWGGSSSHYYLVSVRGSRHLWDSWAAELGVEGAHWAYDNILPHMKEVEHYTPVNSTFDPAQRGQDGLLSIYQLLEFDVISSNNFATNIWPAATNMPVIEDYNAATAAPLGGALGISDVQGFFTGTVFGVPPTSVGQRAQSQNSFCPTPLDSAVNPNAIITTDGMSLSDRKLQIISDAVVSRVLFDGTTAIGVEYILEGNQVHTIYARKEIILCAGATITPAILQRSGVGPQALLESLDIPVVFANENVGIDFANHYGATCVMNVTNPDNIAPLLFTAFSDGAPYLNNDPVGDGIRHIQIVGIPSFVGSQQLPLAAQLAVDPDSIVNPERVTNTFFSAILNPKSRGTIQIVSTDCTVSPQINIPFYGDGTGPGSDFDNTLAFFKIIRDVADEAGETMIYPTPAMYASDDLLRQAARLSPFIFQHNAGTCRMSIHAADGVTGPDLRVHGVENLRCADLSVSPIINDGNTGFPGYYIGRVCAALIRNEI